MNEFQDSKLPGSDKVRNLEIEYLTKEYDVSDVMGRGRFGTVRKVINKATGKIYAAKTCLCRRPGQRKDVELEIELMRELQHEKVVSFHHAFVSAKEVVMVMELITGGELFDRIIDVKFDLTEELAASYVKQICEAVGFIHSRNILHLDLKPENILCVSPDNLNQVKIIDFGLARRFAPNTTLKVMLGTPEFVAPEVVNFDPLGKGTDMWSVGVITYVLLSGLSPFMGDSNLETFSNITGGEWDFDDECFNEISDDAKDFVEKLLVPNEMQRMQCDKCLQHPWIIAASTRADKLVLSTKTLAMAVVHLKKYVARRKWACSITAIRAINRLHIALKKKSDEKTNDTEKNLQ